MRTAMPWLGAGVLLLTLAGEPAGRAEPASDEPGAAATSTSRIRPSTRRLDDKAVRRAQERGRGAITRDEKDHHTVFLFVNIRFADDRYNNDTYLRSFDSISAQLRTASQAHPMPLGIEFHECRKPHTSRFECLATLDFRQKPVIGATLEVKIGPLTIRQTISGDMFKWEARQWEIAMGGAPPIVVPWSISFSDLDVVVNAIDWLVVLEAAFLQEGSDAPWIRVSVANDTPKPMPPGRLGFIAEYVPPSGFVYQYKVVRPATCPYHFRGYDAKLTWELTASDEIIGTPAKLKGANVPAAVTYNDRAWCARYSIGGTIPVADPIPPGSRRHYYLRLRELPLMVEDVPVHRKTGEVLAQVPARNLREWHRMEVRLVPPAGIAARPLRTGVRR